MGWGRIEGDLAGILRLCSVERRGRRACGEDSRSSGGGGGWGGVAQGTQGESSRERRMLVLTMVPIAHVENFRHAIE